jgi:hypothetical protein
VTKEGAAVRTKSVILLLGALALSGCGAFSERGTAAPPIDDDSLATRRAEDGSVLDLVGVDSTITSDPNRGEAFVGSVNRHLWRASLDTLSFLPIASTDPFTGVIATDWGTALDTETERFRVTAFVTSTALSPESLRVAVFREVRDDRGAWVTAPVAVDTPRQIEDSILVRARQLRIAEREAG